MSTAAAPQRTFLGHPPGLFVLFFAEMWERFSFYGMRALLLLYMGKGFLQYNDNRALAVYGAYTSLVYMMPFFGGLLADRFLGQRIAVIIGGTLMAAGHLVMMAENTLLFYLALALLIVGNGFFKPNISTMVGQLYGQEKRKRDGGFTIFYMGVNLGAALSPLLCGFVAAKYGDHWGFGLATIGMLTGLAIFVMPTLVTQVLIGAAAILAAASLYWFVPESSMARAISAAVALCLLAAAVISIRAMTLGGVPDDIGRPPSGKARFLNTTLVGTVICISLLYLFVSDFSIINEGEPVRLISDAAAEQISSRAGSLHEVVKTFLIQLGKPSGGLVTVTGFLAFGYLIIKAFSLERVARQRMYVVLILTFFSMLFWAFFEQAGSSITNFTDRNVDRVAEESKITSADVGKTIQLQPTQEQVGFKNGDKLFTLTQLDKLREEKKENKEAMDFTIDWIVTEDNVGMGIAQQKVELPTQPFQSVNAVFILLFALPFTALWGWLANRGMEPAAPYKFSLGLLQLGLGFGALWFGAANADSRGMVAVFWLLLGYALHTTGELCLSPVGLSMITKLAPKILVSTVMGAWFLATAFSQYLAMIISQFTGVTEGEGKETVIPPPIETVNVYGDVFKVIAIAALISGVICIMLAPLLQKWMHQNEE